MVCCCFPDNRLSSLVTDDKKSLVQAAAEAAWFLGSLFTTLGAKENVRPNPPLPRHRYVAELNVPWPESLGPVLQSPMVQRKQNAQGIEIYLVGFVIYPLINLGMSASQSQINSAPLSPPFRYKSNIENNNQENNINISNLRHQR